MDSQGSSEGGKRIKGEVGDVTGKQEVVRVM